MQSDLTSIDGAGDLTILVLKIAGSGDLVISHDELASDVAFAVVDLGMKRPQAWKILRCVRRGRKQEGRCSYHQQRILLNILRFLATDLRIPLVCAGTSEMRDRSTLPGRPVKNSSPDSSSKVKPPRQG